MGPENSKKLTERFSFLRTSGDPMKDSMVFGFECGDGWFQTIWDLCIDLEKMDKENQKNIPDDKRAKSLLERGYDQYSFQVVQVKEKMGTLRFYAQGSSEEMWKRIQIAENATSTICEECGEEGELKRENGWYKVRCKNCN